MLSNNCQFTSYCGNELSVGHSRWPFDAIVLDQPPQNVGNMEWNMGILGDSQAAMRRGSGCRKARASFESTSG
uniref:Uncharacterized protein n=1 Tax=Oryza punctata TaxID=4537 RepID=A0A0E0LE10_ORYPU